jgi:hypothetical protein
MSWAEQASCRGEWTELFFPTNYNSPDQIAPALDMCARCPVAVRCLDAALAEESDVGAGYRYGIRGGLTPGQRWQMYLAAAPNMCEICGNTIIQPVNGRRAFTCSPVCARARHNRRRRLATEEISA